MKILAAEQHTEKQEADMNDIIAIIETNPVACLTDEQVYANLYSHIKAEVEAFTPDLLTVTGRQKVAALAYKVKRTKTAIDAAGKQLNEEARAKINAVDAQRRKIREELDSLAEEARRPLTEWEENEEARLKTVEAKFTHFHNAALIVADDTSATISMRLSALETESIDEAVFQDRHGEACQAHTASILRLREAKERILKQEADAAELARLRAEQETREQAEREAQARAEAEKAERERAERDAAEAKRNEEDEARRREEAAERAREEEKRRADEAIAKAEAEKRAVIEKAEREERERTESAERQKAEDERRAADRKHRAKIMGDARAAIMAIGTDEETAKKIVLAIVAGEIPNVTLRF